MARVTLFLLAGVAIFSTETMAGPDVQQIVRRSTNEIEVDWNQAPNYSFIERDLESKHDAQPSIKTYEVTMIDGSPYNRLVGSGNEPLSTGEQADQQRKLHDEIRKRQHESSEQRSRRITKYLKERRQDEALLKGMVNAFAFAVVGTETVDGYECWVLDASPKPGYQPVSRETKVLEGMRGRLWIDKAGGQWVKVRAEAFETVSFYGFLAKVHPGTQFLLEQGPVAGNIWLPKHFRAEVRASVLGLFNEDSIDDETYSNYRPTPQALSQLGSQ